MTITRARHDKDVWPSPTGALLLLCAVCFSVAAAPTGDAAPQQWGSTVTINNPAHGANYGRMVKLADGSWLAVTTIYPAGLPSQLQFLSSTDACRTWRLRGVLFERTRKVDNGQVLQLRDGSLLVAMRSLIDGASYRLPVYRSTDKGRTWRRLSIIDANEQPHGRRDRGLWEPHLNLLADGRLAVMYANEKHADEVPSSSQVVSQRVLKDHGATWGDEIRVVAEPGGGKLRPGMPVWTRMRDGRWIVVYEIVERDADVYYKISDDGTTWAGDLGTRIPDQRCGPYVLALPEGRLLVTSCSNEVSLSDDYGATWQRLDPPPWALGYSHTWPSLYAVSPGEFAVMAAVPRADKQRSVALRFGKLAKSQRRPPRAVVLTTDIGAEMDDQWTLAHLSVAPEIDLRGVVTTHAPSLPAPAAETAARVAEEVLRRFPRPKPIPVVAGSSQPLADVTRPRPNPGVELLLRESRSFSARDRLGVLVTGAATDVASALLIDPGFASRVEVIAMGFENWEEGGDSWNVKNDPAAWRVLLAADVPLIVGDARITRRDLAMTRGWARRLFGAHGAAGDYLVRLLTDWLDRDPAFTRRVTGRPDTWVIWDEVVTAYLLGLTRETTYPRPSLRDDLRFSHQDTAAAQITDRTITWIRSIDKRRLWSHFATMLTRYQQTR